MATASLDSRAAADAPLYCGLRVSEGQAGARCKSEQITRNRTIKNHLPQASVLLLPLPQRCRPYATYTTSASSSGWTSSRWQTPLLAAFCPAGGRDAGAIWAREEQHHFNSVFVIGRKDDVDVV